MSLLFGDKVRLVNEADLTLKKHYPGTGIVIGYDTHVQGVGVYAKSFPLIMVEMEGFDEPQGFHPTLLERITDDEEE